jgi:DnaK suppressor protein
MDRRQTQRFKTRLETRHHELRVSIEHQLRNARGVEPEPDTLDQATRQSEKEVLLQTSTNEKQLLRAVELALGRIQDGTFGHCLSCAKEIDEKRLQAVPWTRYCIHCQEDFER